MGKLDKMDKELGMKEMIGMFDADQPSKKEQSDTVESNQANQDADNDLSQVDSSTPLKIQNPAPALNTKENSKDIRRPSKSRQTTKSARRKKQTNTINDSEEVTNTTIYDRLQTFNKEFTRGHCFTSVRILKKKREYLCYLFPENTIISIIDILITDHLIKNREKIRGIIEDKKRES